MVVTDVDMGYKFVVVVVVGRRVMLMNFCWCALQDDLTVNQCFKVYKETDRINTFVSVRGSV